LITFVTVQPKADEPLAQMITLFEHKVSMVFAARVGCAIRRKGNWFVERRRRAHIDRRQEPLRCAAKR